MVFCCAHLVAYANVVRFSIGDSSEYRFDILTYGANIDTEGEFEIYISQDVVDLPIGKFPFQRKFPKFFYFSCTVSHTNPAELEIFDKNKAVMIPSAECTSYPLTGYWSVPIFECIWDYYPTFDAAYDRGIG